MNAPEISGDRIREPEYPAYDPWAVVSVVIHDLATHAVKSRFGDLSGAAIIAADLLEALGVRPVIPEDDAGRDGAR